MKTLQRDYRGRLRLMGRAEKLTISMRRTPVDDADRRGRVHLEQLSEPTSREYFAKKADQPKERGDCVDGPRPCPWVSCRYHLAIEVTDQGGLVLTHPGKQIDELEETCALDVADMGEQSLEAVGAHFGITRERVRQIEAKAIKRASVRSFGLRFGHLLDSDEPEGWRREG